MDHLNTAGILITESFVRDVDGTMNGVYVEIESWNTLCCTIEVVPCSRPEAYFGPI